MAELDPAWTKRSPARLHELLLSKAGAAVSVKRLKAIKARAVGAAAKQQHVDQAAAKQAALLQQSKLQHASTSEAESSDGEWVEDDGEDEEEDDDEDEDEEDERPELCRQVEMLTTEAAGADCTAERGEAIAAEIVDLQTTMSDLTKFDELRARPTTTLL